MNKPRGRPFPPGNKIGRGRPKGRKNNVTLVCRKRLEEYAVPLVSKCIAQALQGDSSAMRLCMERLLAVERDAKVTFPAGPIRDMSELAGAGRKIWDLTSVGVLTPVQADQLTRMLERQRQMLEATTFEDRLSQLEEGKIMRHDLRRRLARLEAVRGYDRFAALRSLATRLGMDPEILFHKLAGREEQLLPHIVDDGITWEGFQILYEAWTDQGS